MTTQDMLSTSQTEPLAAVLKKFPGAKAKIRYLFQHSPSFRSLCEDYRDCLSAWQYWRRAASEEAPTVCRSYAELILELEEEIRQYLGLSTA
jgi:hypothetical protein